MGIFITKIGDAIQTSDFFASPVLLRYKTEENKTSKTGGIFSIFLIILMISVFYNSWLSVFNKTNLTSNHQVIRQMDPTAVLVNNQNFIIAIGLPGIDILAKQNKYIDVDFIYEERQFGVMAKEIYIDMVHCQQRHFKKFTGDLVNIFEKQQLGSFACLPDNFSVNITGKWSSQIFAYIRIQTKRCQSNCTTDEEIDVFRNTYGAFSIDYYFINKLINPTLNDPVSIYFEDKYYDMLNDELAIDTNVYISEYEIETDESLLPIQDINKSSGIFIDRTEKEDFIFPSTDQTYANFHFRKSDQKIKIKRSYRKVDDLLSYLGGLFGLMITFFGCILVNYNKCCYQLQMARKIFRNQNVNEKQNIKQVREAVHCATRVLDSNDSSKENINFNFFVYLKYCLAKLFFVLFPTSQFWKSMKKVKETINETQNQMNIDVILQRITFYERAFQCIFDPDQLTLLMLQQKVSIQELKAQRDIMDFEDQSFIKNYGKQECQLQKCLELQVTRENEKQFNQMTLHIYDAIAEIKKRAKTDPVCKKILHGIRKDFMKEYHKYESKGQRKNRDRISVFSKFNGSSKEIGLDNRIFLSKVGLFNKNLLKFGHCDSDVKLKSETSSQGSRE